jgi:hypothetical protein
VQEAWLLETIASIREAARAANMPRLAEHLDDAILIAASEAHHGACVVEGEGRYGGPAAEAFRGDARHGVH